MKNRFSTERLSKNLLILLTCLALASCGSDEPEDNSAEFESFLANAENFLDQGQYQAAIIEARNAVQTKPGDPRGHIELAKILVELGQPREAIKGLEALNADSADYYLELANAYFRTGKFRSASDLLTTHSEKLVDRPLRSKLLWGNISLARGDTVVAEARFNEVLALDANNTEAKFGLIKSAAVRGDLASVETDLAALLETDPNNAEALLLSSSLQASNGDLDKAEELLMNAVSSLSSTDVLTPLRFSILSALRDVLLAQGKTSEALIYSSLLAESAPQAQEANQKLQEAMDAISAGELDNARALLNEVLEIAPNSDRAGTMLGVVDYLQGDSSAAIDQFEKFVDPETAAPLALQIFTMAELQLKQPEKVIERLKADIDNMKDAKIVALYGIASISAGDTESGEKYLVKSLSLDPDNGRLRLPLARLFNIQEKQDDALQQVRFAYESQPQDALIQSSYLAQLITMEKTAEAGELTNELEKLYPSSQPTQLIVGNFRLSQQDIAAARATFEKVLALGESLPARYQLVRINAAEKKFDDAEAGLREIIGINSNDPEAYKGLITIFEVQGRGAEGVTAVRKYAADGDVDAPRLVLSEYYGRNSDFEQAFEYLGQLSEDNALGGVLSQQLHQAKASKQLAEKDYDGARQSLMDGLSSANDNPQLLSLLVSVELVSERLDEATRVFEQIKELIPDAPVIALLAGDIAQASGDLETAQAEYQTVWSITPSDQLAVKVYQVMRKRSLAEEPTLAFLNEWREKLPNSQLGWLTLAGHFMENGDMTRAQTEYEALVEANPNIVVAHNNLAWIYGEGKLNQAVAAAKKAFDLAPESGEIIDTYAWFLYKKGDISEAKTMIAKAASLLPDNVEVQQHFEEISAQ